MFSSFLSTYIRARILHIATVVTLFICSVHVTFAAPQLLISEIHYNPVGTDDKHEYIEVCNVGADAQDIAGYKLYESSANHGLTLSRGSSTLGTNQCAVFVIDPVTFLADFPSFSATLFDVSFSLSNTGEALILRDANGADVDGISYLPAQGGNGDGKTLHRSGTIFTAGVASPGTEPGLVGTSATTSGTGSTTASGTNTGSAGTSINNSTSVETNTPGTSVTTVFHTVTIEPPAQLFVRTQSTITAATGSVVTFTAESYNAKGTAEDAQYSWVYGDGMRDTTAQNSGKVSHVYKRAGEYEAIVTATKGSLTGEARVRVVVEDSPLTLALVADDAEVQIENTGTVSVDMTGMRLTFAHNTSQVYTFPDKTRILPKKRLILPLVDIGLTDPRRPREVVLIYADGIKKLTAKGSVEIPPSAPTAVRVPEAPMTLLGYGKTVPTAQNGLLLSSTRSVPIVAVSGASAVGNNSAINPTAPSLVKDSKNITAEAKKALPKKKLAIAKSAMLSSHNTLANAAGTDAASGAQGSTKSNSQEVVESAQEKQDVSQTATAMNTLPYTPTWVLVLAGLALLGSGLYASWVLGKTSA